MHILFPRIFINFLSLVHIGVVCKINENGEKVVLENSNKLEFILEESLLFVIKKVYIDIVLYIYWHVSEPHTRRMA